MKKETLAGVYFNVLRNSTYFNKIGTAIPFSAILLNVDDAFSLRKNEFSKPRSLASTSSPFLVPDVKPML